MTDPIDLARRAGYLDHFLGAKADDHLSFSSPEVGAAWLEGWHRRQSDIDAASSSEAERRPVEPKDAGSTPASLPSPS